MQCHVHLQEGYASMEQLCSQSFKREVLKDANQFHCARYGAATVSPTHVIEFVYSMDGRNITAYKLKHVTDKIQATARQK